MWRERFNPMENESTVYLANCFARMAEQCLYSCLLRQLHIRTRVVALRETRLLYTSLNSIYYEVSFDFVTLRPSWLVDGEQTHGVARWLKHCDCVTVSPKSLVVEIDSFDEFSVQPCEASHEQMDFQLSSQDYGIIELNSTSVAIAGNSTNPVSVRFYAASIRADFFVELNGSDVKRFCPNS
ncbi:unnamed protein product [Soboliphyme baturini]|uniref:Beta-mannosidase n=1 Tax=Soboliphyme baturini TaxID=241478 RepID=A0A183IKC8_9BILA|nr:unnamed protein product [Soboliphyme baturini]